eukprot:scaffold249325_cov30-Tisochrysis_lutea.AAC.8
MRMCIGHGAPGMVSKGSRNRVSSDATRASKESAGSDSKGERERHAFGGRSIEVRSVETLTSVVQAAVSRTKTLKARRCKIPTRQGVDAKESRKRHRIAGQIMRAFQASCGRGWNPRR